MAHVNIEIKARCNDPDRVRQALADAHADFRGTDRQVDTYFNCSAGRLKLRQGDIECALIHYRRGDGPGPRKAVVTVSGKPVATYIHADKKIKRPYFAHVKTRSGIQVTRNHPPIVGKDRKDHDTMHPGIWMAFAIWMAKISGETRVKSFMTGSSRNQAADRARGLLR